MSQVTQTEDWVAFSSQSSLCYLLLFFVFTAFNSLHVANAKKELPVSLPGPNVQWCASSETAFPQEGSNWVRKTTFWHLKYFAAVVYQKSHSFFILDVWRQRVEGCLFCNLLVCHSVFIFRWLCSPILSNSLSFMLSKIYWKVSACSCATSSHFILTTVSLLWFSFYWVLCC